MNRLRRLSSFLMGELMVVAESSYKGRLKEGKLK